jgi:hypothetical protein
MPPQRMRVGLLLVFTAVGRILAADTSDFKPFTSREGDLEIEIEGTTTYSRLVLAGNRLYVIMAYPDGTSGSPSGQSCS